MQFPDKFLSFVKMEMDANSILEFSDKREGQVDEQDCSFLSAKQRNTEIFFSLNLIKTINYLFSLEYTWNISGLKS